MEIEMTRNWHFISTFRFWLKTGLKLIQHLHFFTREAGHPLLLCILSWLLGYDQEKWTQEKECRDLQTYFRSPHKVKLSNVFHRTLTRYIPGGAWITTLKTTVGESVCTIDVSNFLSFSDTKIVNGTWFLVHTFNSISFLTPLNVSTVSFFCLLWEVNRELHRIHIIGCRYNERLNAKTEGSKRLAYTGLRG